MTTTCVAVALIALHILVCLFVWMLVRIGILNVKGHLLVFMLLVPVWGSLCVLALEVRGLVHGDNLRASTLEALRNNDRVHRQLLVEGREGDAETVPLEEALIVDAAHDRRRLMLQILNDDPEGYIALLKGASLNDDAEVAHYAAAAMSQITKEADVKLQRLEQAYAADPADGAALAEYCDYLGNYLDSGLAEGKAAQLQRDQYARLLERRLSQAPDDAGLLRRAAAARLDLGDYDAADALIDRLLTASPQDEDGWVLRLREAAAARDGELLSETLDRMDAEHVYLGPRAREAVGFWRGASTPGASHAPAQAPVPEGGASV